MFSLIISTNKLIKAVARGCPGDHYENHHRTRTQQSQDKMGTKRIGITKDENDEVSW